MRKFKKGIRPKGFSKLEPCPECGRWKTYNDGGGFICTNIKRCNLAISKEDDLAEVDKTRGAEWQKLISHNSLIHAKNIRNICLSTTKNTIQSGG